MRTQIILKVLNYLKTFKITTHDEHNMIYIHI